MTRKLQILATLLAAAFVTAQAQAGSVDELVAALSGDDVQARAAAYEGAARYGPEAIGPVAALLDSEDPLVVRAAKLALEKIVGPACWRVPGPPVLVWDQTHQGLALERTQRVVASEALCAAAKSVRSREGRNWLLWLLSYTGGPEVVRDLIDLMDDPQTFDMALFALQAIGREDGAMASLLLTLRGIASTERIGGIEEICIPELALFLKLYDASDEQRVAIINVLGAMGGEAAESVLLDQMARLEKKTGKKCSDVGCATIQALGRTGCVKAKGMLLDRVKSHGCPNATDAYLRIAEQQGRRAAAKMYARLLPVSEQPQIQCAALYGLGQTAKSRAVKKIAPFLSAERGDVYGSTKEALIELDGTSVDRRLRSTFRRVQPPVQSAILEVLHARDAETALPFLDKALDHDSAEVRVTALLLLGKTADPDLRYESTFLEVARTGSEGARPVALRGYINLAAQALGQGDTDKALAMYHTALSTAQRNEERALALEGMAAIASRDSIPYLEDHVDNLDLRPSVGNCALAIAEKTSDREFALDIFNAVLDHAVDRAMANRAAAGLRSLGVEVDVAARMGFIARWQMIGPFQGTSFAAVYAPETEFKANAAYDGAGGQRVKWMDYKVEDAAGVVPLHEIYRPKDDVIMYARAEVTVDADQNVLVKMGSDDGIVCWVNGEKIHENDASRGVGVDQDVKPARLKAGANVIQVKIVQGGGDWAFCVRLTDPDDNPLKFTQ